MKSNELATLLRAHRGNAHTVANLYILRQSILEPDDRVFLREHIEGLRSLDLFWWLALEHRDRDHHDASDVLIIVDRLVVLAGREPGEIVVGALDAARKIDRDAWADLAERIAPLTTNHLRHALFCATRGGQVFDACARADQRFSALRGAVVTPSLTELLFSLRRDDRACRTELDRIARRSLDAASTNAIESTHVDAFLEHAKLTEVANWVRAEIDRPAPVTRAMSASNEVFDPGSMLLDDDDRDVISSLDAPGTRTNATPDPAQLLLERLDQLSREGAGMRRQVELVIAHLIAHAPDRALMLWLSPRLSSRSAWEQAGPALFEALIEHKAWAELCELVAMSNAPAVTIGAVFARALVARATRLIEPSEPTTTLTQGEVGDRVDGQRASNQRGAIAALSALICLDPPSIITPALHDLERRARPHSDVAALAAAAIRLFRRSKGQDANVEGLVAAVHALAAIE